MARYFIDLSDGARRVFDQEEHDFASAEAARAAALAALRATALGAPLEGESRGFWSSCATRGGGMCSTPR